MKPSEAFLSDRRVVHRHIEKGLITQEAHDAELAGLKDSAGNSAMTSIPIVRVSARKAVSLKALGEAPADETPFDDDEDEGDDD